MTRFPLSRTTLALALLACPAFAAIGERTCPDDPYADPANDPCNILKYIPNKAINILAAALYLLVATALTYRAIRQRADYFMCLVLGAWAEGAGFVMRVVAREHPQSVNLFIVHNLFIVLPPCAFLAGDYILFGRLVASLSASQHVRPLTPRIISWIFISSDLFTFAIQGTGGSLATTDAIDAGQKLFLVGLALQLAVFVIFSALWALFGVRVYLRDAAQWNREGWKPLYWAMGFTCICFVLRSFFRVIELGQGYGGHLATHEVYFLTLDSLPLLLGIAAYVIFWPGAWLHFPKGWKNNRKGGGDVMRGGVESTVERGLMMSRTGTGAGSVEGSGRSLGK
ncbi:hypothetical protein IAT38_005239 [Cryptococcus sp. DSM 104549]